MPCGSAYKLAYFAGLGNTRGVKTLAVNKRAKFDYEILETYEGGLQLLGTEVKSVRAGHMSLKGAFVTIHAGEAFLINATIPAWQIQNAPIGYDPERPRKVLLRKEELKHLIGSKESSGLTIVPVRVYNKGIRVKLELGLVRGKKQYDKKQKKKERDIKRDVDRMLRGKE